MVAVKTNQEVAFKELNKAFQALFKRTSDLRPAFETISSDFYKSNKPLVFSARPGKFVDLKPKTKQQKQRKFGSEYPVLVATGRLSKSLMIRGSDDNITVINKKTMVLGSSVPYARYLQEGTSRMPARPPLLLDVGRRVFRWLRIINEYAITGKK